NLLGINSVYTPRPLRQHVWERLATDLKPRHLDSIVTRTIDFEQLPAAFDDYLKAGITGRTVVRIARCAARMADTTLTAGAAQLGSELDERQAARLIRLLDELDDWNQRMNLTAIRERTAQITKHLLD